MKRNNLILISLITTILLSSFVLGAVQTPGDFFRNFGSGFSTNFITKYRLTIILYFAILLAIFMEGIKFIPMFGQKGEVNKMGKVFATSAAGLSVLGIFFAETTTGLSTTELAQRAIAPFGVWGGIVISALFAMISYFAVRDLDAFEDKIAIPMAICLAMGITIAGWLLSMNNLMGWGYLIMLITFVVGLISYFRGDGQPEKPEDKSVYENFGKKRRDAAKLASDMGNESRANDILKEEEKELNQIEKLDDKEIKYLADINRLFEDIRKRLETLENSSKNSEDVEKELKKIKNGDLRKIERDVYRMSQGCKKILNGLEVVSQMDKKNSSEVEDLKKRIHLFEQKIIKSAASGGSLDHEIDDKKTPTQEKVKIVKEDVEEAEESANALIAIATKETPKLFDKIEGEIEVIKRQKVKNGLEMYKRNLNFFDEISNLLDETRFSLKSDMVDYVKISQPIIKKLISLVQELNASINYAKQQLHKGDLGELPVYLVYINSSLKTMIRMLQNLRIDKSNNPNSEINNKNYSLVHSYNKASNDLYKEISKYKVNLTKRYKKLLSEVE